jgi:hypothetical protein
MSWGCFEDLMEFKENMAEAEKRRKGKARPSEPNPSGSGNLSEEKMNTSALPTEVAGV